MTLTPLLESPQPQAEKPIPAPGPAPATHPPPDLDRPDIPRWLSPWLKRYPFLIRHPHPLCAHFTIVLMLATTFFNVLYLITGVQSFETAAFHCLGGGVLCTPATNLTGHFTRWLNYPGKLSQTMILEIRLSWALLAISLSAFIWRFLEPGILLSLSGVGIIYLFLVLSVAPLVTVIGFFGGMLTFPLGEK